MALFTIFGGTGFLGSRIVRQLSASGHRVRVAARDPGQVEETAKLTPVEADIRRPDTIGPALEGADGAVNAVSLYVEQGATTFEAIHVKGAARLAQEAKAAGLSHFIHVSGIGADATSNDPFIRSRGRGEASVRAACPFATLVRPSVMVGKDDAIRATILGVTRLQPFFPLFGKGETRLQPVHRDDTAKAIAKLINDMNVVPSVKALPCPDLCLGKSAIGKALDAVPGFHAVVIYHRSY
ncbi:NAD(P)H-binding protein [Roseovarius sp. B08]|uniref:NAD(P)H-binding protein n=1 Tax=Roseovarius sp. B08 TaxID=3449223 RepID=UPI003EDC2084